MGKSSRDEMPSGMSLIGGGSTIAISVAYATEQRSTAANRTSRKRLIVTPPYAIPPNLLGLTPFASGSAGKSVAVGKSAVSNVMPSILPLRLNAN